VHRALVYSARPDYSGRSADLVPAIIDTILTGVRLTGGLIVQPLPLVMGIGLLLS
jgi:hypothetical protein